jgi:CHAD domain-containing protein
VGVGAIPPSPYSNEVQEFTITVTMLPCSRSGPYCEVTVEVALAEVEFRLPVVPERLQELKQTVEPLGPSSVRAVYAAPVTLQGSMTVESALQSIGRSCIGHVRGNEPAALSGQAEGVHQIRVAVRRLRVALSAVKPMIPREHYDWAQEELKWLAGQLGLARDWDVFAANLLEPRERVLAARSDLRLLADAAERRRDAAYARAKVAIESSRYTATMLKLSQWFWHDQPVSKEAALFFATIGDVAPGLIERRWRQARKRSRHFGKLAPAQRHELRIALKKLRYTIEFLRDLFDKDQVKALEKRLKPLQEELGHMNDVQTAQDLVADISRQVGKGGNEIGCAGGFMLGWYNRGLSDRESKLRKDVRRLRRAKPFWPRAKAPLGSHAEVSAIQDQSIVSPPITHDATGTIPNGIAPLENVPLCPGIT